VKPLLLALDTTHEFGSLALVRGGETLQETAVRAPEGFAHVIYGELRKLLDRQRVSLGEIDCFASASGPGSFTGVRVGLSCIKGLAEACGKPALAVSNLQVLASFGTRARRVPLIDARRGQVYAAVYDATGEMVEPEVVTSLGAWLASVPGNNLELVSMDFAPLEEELAASSFASTSRVTAPRALAAEIGKIASRRFCAGDAGDPAVLDANYVRRSDAELFWKD
jgi:tRNA threonylcarbamoyladenosine biosynthesis protein TsaB